MTGKLYIKLDAESRRTQHNLINMSVSTWQEQRNVHAQSALRFMGYDSTVL